MGNSPILDDNEKTNFEGKEKKIFPFSKKKIFLDKFSIIIFPCRDCRPDEEVEELMRALITLLLWHLKIL